MPDSSPFDRLTESLRAAGLGEDAGRLHSLLHETAWTSSSELLGELGLELRRIKKQHWRRLDEGARSLLQECAAAVHKGWPAMRI
jgi:hypothetical protein